MLAPARRQEDESQLHVGLMRGQDGHEFQSRTQWGARAGCTVSSVPSVLPNPLHSRVP